MAKPKKTSSTTDPERSRIMRAVKAKDTAPEMIVRRLLHRLGYRYRLHREGLPGKPDLVFPIHKAVIFVHGCFWHGHYCKRGARTPKTNTKYWTDKICRNVARDAQAIKDLKTDDWRVKIVWECELKNLASLQKKLVAFLNK